MYDLLVSLQKIIERKVVNIQTIREDISAGETMIPVKSAKRFETCSEVVFYRDGEGDGEIKQILHIPDYHTIELTEGVDEDYSATNARVQNLVSGQWMRDIHLGDPPVIGRYPCITIAPKSRSSEWLTIDSTSERFEVDISCYIQASGYDKMFEYITKLTRTIENTLFNNFYPLVMPFATTTLVEDVSSTDTVIRVVEDDLQRQFAWFFLENDKYTRNASPSCYLENGVIELKFPIGVPFSAGDDVIFPGRHFYDTRAQSTDYGNVAKDALLYGSRISFFATQEALRQNPYFEPINRP